MGEFDVLVIGTGVTGQTVVEELAGTGLRVAVVDRREYGGTCLLRGCEAKKALYSVAEVVERAAALRRKGLAGMLKLDWPSLIAFKREFTDPAPADVEAAFRQAGATLLRGEARFAGPGSVAIDEDVYEAAHVVVATGARPAALGLPGEQLVKTSEDFMAAEDLPPRIVFIGGGYISTEFAHLATAAGAAVTICSRGPRLLAGFDPDLVDMLIRAYRDDGIRVLTEAPVSAVQESGEELVVRLADGRGLAADMVVHGAGRVPDLEVLDLAAGDVRSSRRGVEVDERLRSLSNPRVWAAGDAAARGLPLTPVGIAQGRVVGQNIRGAEAVFDPEATPSVVFANPPLAAIGLTEEAAAERGLEVDARFHDRSSWASTRRAGARVAAAKILVERDSDLVVGAHLLGPHADEMINVLAAAMAGRLTAARLRTMLWAYPTNGWELVHLL